MSDKAIRWQNIGGWIVIAIALALWPLVDKLIALGVHPMVAESGAIALATFVWYRLFVRRA